MAAALRAAPAPRSFVRITIEQLPSIAGRMNRLP
jgi:hypothetical protein